MEGSVFKGGWWFDCWLCSASCECQLAKGPVAVGIVSGHAITIRDVSKDADTGDAGAGGASGAGEGSEADALLAADEDMARRLQAKLDAKSIGAGSGR